MGHFNFLETVNGISDGWGSNFASMNDAQRNLIDNPDKMAAFAALEMLKRFDAVARAMRPSTQPTVESRKIPFVEAGKPFPHVKVGEFLWTGDLWEGIYKCVVLAKNDQQLCMVCVVDDFDTECPPHIRIADSDYYETEEQAVRAGALDVIEYHGKRYERAKRAIEACDSGADLSEFEDAIED